MEQIEIVKPFRFAIDGTQVVEIKPGRYAVGDGKGCDDRTISRRAAQIARENEWSKPAKGGKPAKAAKADDGKDDDGDLLSGGQPGATPGADDPKPAPAAG